MGTTIHQTIDCPNEKQRYRYWRIRIMYSMMIGYASFYLVRANFSMAIPSMQAELGYTKTEIGLILTMFSLIYGFGKSFNGYLCDRLNARYFMAIGLIASGFFSLFIGMTEGFYVLMVLWCMNGWVQSMGAPPCARLLTHWYSSKELGTKWGIWNSCVPMGSAVAAVITGYIIKTLGWKYAFLIPGGAAIFIGFFVMNRLRDTPESLGLPPVEHYKGQPDTKPVDAEDEHLTHREIFFKYLIHNRMLWYICLGNFFVYIVRMGVLNWAPTFLHEVKGSTLVNAGWKVAALDIAGVLGGISAGYLSDRLLNGRRGPLACIYMIMLGFVIIAFWAVPPGNGMLDTLFLIGVGFLIYGPQMLSGVAAADFSSRKVVGAATGLTGTIGYLGSAIAGVGIGLATDIWGWDGGFVFFVASAFLGAVFFSLTWNHSSAVHTKKPDPKTAQSS